MKIGLVLSGGGGKGAYELGVWKALTDLNISKHISVFSGASIGAFNSVLFAMEDIENAEKLWEEVTMDKLVPISKIELIKRGIGLYLGGKNLAIAKKFLSDKLQYGAISNEGAVEIVNTYLDIEKVKALGKTCYVSCTQLSDFSVKYFNVTKVDEKTAKDMILASASLPLIYDSTTVYDDKYIDGGISDNIPIQPVYGENCNVIIVVLLSREIKIDRGLYPNTKLIIIKPETLEENTLDGTLNLDDISKRKRIKAGYDDTINQLEPIIELLSCIKSKENSQNEVNLEKISSLFKNSISSIKNKFQK